ncbi:MAG: hypothetical protein IKC88_03080 [Opitutales bacterium]|nr:hypothetical protein [Opitutales bacterium]
MCKLVYFCICLSVLALTGCQTHTSQSHDMRVHWSAGNTANAEAKISEISKEESDGTDALIWKLEEGAVARANGNLEKSVKAFSHAQSLIEKFENEPETSISEETQAILTNQSYITYKGYAYDKIMLSVYQALNHIEQKKFDDASVDLKRLEFFQSDAERANQKRIDNDQKAIADAKKKNKTASYNTSRTLNNQQVASVFKKYYGDAYNPDTSAQQAKAVYVNPFAYWLAGLYFANRPLDASDKNRATDMFRLGGEMLANKSEVFAKDFKMAEDLANGKIDKPTNLTYIIFETGSAPIRNQFKINLPIYIVARNVPHISMNFPYLTKMQSHTPELNVSVQGKQIKFDTLADIDAIVQREFDSHLPMVITKTIISASVKAGTQYAIAQSVGDGWEGLAVNIAGSIYQSLMNDADLRTWTTLPKYIKVARIETPLNATINIDGVALKLPTDRVNVVLAKKMNANGKLILRTFDFCDASKSTK